MAISLQLLTFFLTIRACPTLTLNILFAYFHTAMLESQQLSLNPVSPEFIPRNMQPMMDEGNGWGEAGSVSQQSSEWTESPTESDWQAGNHFKFFKITPTMGHIGAPLGHCFQLIVDEYNFCIILVMVCILFYYFST